ncbi:MAG TPA: lipase maturation factor family protein [Bryobacteraceae bacterium]|nr:lipase maturation factor family protein [Bryobacteraceae bacterium]
MSERPLLIFDGNCEFCRIWIRYWTQLTGTTVEHAPAEDGRSLQSVELILPDGEVQRGAQAVVTTLQYAPGWSCFAWAYGHVPGFASVSEAAYRLVAAHRTLFYHLTRLTFGKNISPLRYGGVEWLFLRMLAVIYFIAFGSLGLQITGLVGERGILPASRYLDAIHQMYGFEGYRIAPGIFWIAHSDAFLLGTCWAGVAISLVLLAGYLERVALVALYVLYLSLCSIGQDFLSFQWDMLLLESGFLAIFLGSSKAIVYLFRWLAFRLSFLSGAVKLLSHDPAWRSLDALSFHYWTQPLPTPVAWYMNQLPLGFQRFSTAVVLFTELPIPFLFFMPRRWRFAGAWCILALQSMIFLTGNYTFFNLLTMALCIFLFDDAALTKLRLRARTVRTPHALVAAVAVVILIISGLELWGMFREGDSAIVRAVAPFGIANTYGLFAVMTTSRPEIIVQGSNDGENWLDYEFKYKPGDLKESPKWVEPYQPRLDWQMWFAALSNYPSNPWFSNFMLRILQGSPEVLRLLGKNPFPNAPPKYIRAELYEYTFTDRSARSATGNYWARSRRASYFPARALRVR